MEEVRIILSGLWVALMLTYLLGDVLRIFAGDFKPGEIVGRDASQWMWLAAALIMLIPIVMIVLSLTLSHPAIRWVSIVAAAFLVVFNLIGLPYPSVYGQLPDRLWLHLQRRDHLACVEVGLGSAVPARSERSSRGTIFEPGRAVITAAERIEKLMCLEWRD